MSAVFHHKDLCVFANDDSASDLTNEDWKALYINIVLQLAHERESTAALQTFAEKALREKTVLADLLFFGGIRPCQIYPWRRAKDFPSYCGVKIDKSGENFFCKYKESPECLLRYAQHKVTEGFPTVAGRKNLAGGES